MSWADALLTRQAGLPPAAFPRLRAERDLRIPMPDGATLLADRWIPHGRELGPVVVLRTPYGRTQADRIVRVIAGQGYQVLVVSCRGTFGSTGEWNPFFHEAADGKATLGWLAKQGWFPGRAATFGPSYLGLTQWAVAAEAPDWLAGMAIGVSSADFARLVYHHGAFALGVAVTWIYGLEDQELPLLRQRRIRPGAARAMQRAAETLPVGVVDRALVGHPVRYFADWIAHPPTDRGYWGPIDFTGAAATLPPTSLVAGWYDIFLPEQLADFRRAVAAGRDVHLTVGPWHHARPDAMPAMIADAVRHFRVVLDHEPDERPPVRVYVMGSHTWRDFDTWPPPPAELRRWHLGPDGGLADGELADGELADGEAGASRADTFTYDPADPTPALGGRALDGRLAGPRGQGARERRSDVLTYTTPRLGRDLTVIGAPTVRLRLQTERPYGDLFVRLCDVNGNHSVNICDGVATFTPAQPSREGDGGFVAEVELAPTAHTFLTGHQLRLQVSAGAFPLIARNLGTGADLTGGRAGVTNAYAVHHAGSSLTVPVG